MCKTIDKLLLDFKARQDAGENLMCPRCGYDRMKPKLHTNARSRHADIYICDECGTAEAMLQFMNNPLPLSQWAFCNTDRAPGDFKAVPGADAWAEIQAEQVPYLIKLYDRWKAERDQSDFAEYRIDAHRHCKGLTDIWEEPFHAAYEVEDGTLLIRFRETATGTEVAWDLVGKN